MGEKEKFSLFYSRHHAHRAWLSNFSNSFTTDMFRGLHPLSCFIMFWMEGELCRCGHLPLGRISIFGIPEEPEGRS